MAQGRMLTTGQVASICHVAPRTVVKWIDEGYLKGWKLPVSGDRRVLHEDLVTFMQANGMEDLLTYPRKR